MTVTTEDSGKGRKGCLFAIFSLLSGEKADEEPAEDLPYRRKDYLLTKAERSFFGVLEHVVGDTYLVFTKIRLADLLFLPRNTPSRQSHFNRIQSKHVDFLLCDREQVRPVLAIELDDSSHQSDSRRDRDAFVRSALAAAGLALLRIRAQDTYRPEEVRRSIDDAIGAAQD